MMGLTQQLGFTLATITTLALGQPLPDHLQRLRSFADLEPPTSLADAVALHTEAKRRAARIQQHYGHHRAVLPPLPTSSRPQSATVVGAPIIRPTDFGADPTGATDSSPMMAKALAALLAARGGTSDRTPHAAHACSGAAPHGQAVARLAFYGPLTLG
jgi:hypothetical protein